MEITAEFLRQEIAASEARRDQKLAELNVEIGCLDTLRALLVRLESVPEGPAVEGAPA